MALVTTQNELNFDDTEGLFNVVTVYTGWLANGFDNFRSLTGNALKLDSISTNSTILDDKGE